MYIQFLVEFPDTIPPELVPAIRASLPPPGPDQNGHMDTDDAEQVHQPFRSEYMKNTIFSNISKKCRMIMLYIYRDRINRTLAGCHHAFSLSLILGRQGEECSKLWASDFTRSLCC